MLYAVPLFDFLPGSICSVQTEDASVHVKQNHDALFSVRGGGGDTSGTPITV